MRIEEERRAVILGAIIGAVSGSLLAVLYRRSMRQRQAEEAKPIEAGQVVRLVASMVSVVRQFLELMS